MRFTDRRSNDSGIVLLIVILMAVLISGCGASQPQEAAPAQPSETSAPPPTATTKPSETSTEPPTETTTPSPTTSPSPTESPTPAASPTETETATPEPAIATANGSVNCRYGPDKAYLYAWGLSEGDTALIHGANYAKTWLWVEPHDTTWRCWIAASTVTASVDLADVPVVYPILLTNPSVGSPNGVNASRNGNKVSVTWNAAPPAVDLGYLIEARVCTEAGYLWDMVFSTQATAYNINDYTNCGGGSYGQVRVFNKLGYSEPVKIPWP